MFRLPAPDQTLPTEVDVVMPTRDGSETRRMTCHFRLLPTDELAAVAGRGDAEYLAAIIADWEGVEDHEGKPLPCNDETRLQLGRIACFARAAIRAYQDRIAPGKNS